MSDRLTAIFVLPATFFFVVVAGLSCLLPAAADAYTAVAPAPAFSAAPGLPDGREYVQVSPPNKGAFQAGALVQEGKANRGMAVASADGNAVAFTADGPIGESFSGLDQTFVAQRSNAGWGTRSALPRIPVIEPFASTRDVPNWVEPSADLSRWVFADEGAYVPSPDDYCDANIYLAGPDPLVAPVWVGRPLIDNPVVTSDCAAEVPVGGSPDLGTLYFTYAGTLLPEDESRAPHVDHQSTSEDPWGFYEYRNGTLSEAGVLPDGSLDQFGAVPAAIWRGSNGKHLYSPDQLHNEISADGLRAFFVSPDPVASTVTDPTGCAAAGPCSGAPPELYVRETENTNFKTILVSQSQLPGHVGQPAPDGPLAVGGLEASSTFVQASPDGSQAFFASTDPLTSGAPNDTTVKEYDFNVDTGSLTYMPGVVGPAVVSASNGSWLLFENTAGSPELDLWKSGPNGGTVTKVVQIPGVTLLTPVRVSANGSVIVFSTDAAIAGFNNGDGGIKEIYRYDMPAAELSCVSCPPIGVLPTGDAVLSGVEEREEGGSPVSGFLNPAVDVRGISADGSRVFFDTPDPLVPQDTNGTQDVYEWENGTVFLISSGASPNPSVFLDNSESGSDVFFATSQGLVPSDTDGSYDVYDARIPHPGDNPPLSAVSCQGDVCQGPPRVPAPLGAPASVTFSGLGNFAPEPVVQPAAKPKPTPKATKCKKGFVKKKNKCVNAKSKSKSKSKKKAKKSSLDGRGN
jgi:hypothetical protein